MHLEIEIIGIGKSLEQLNQAANGWRTERTMVKELIRIDQDQIFNDEYLLTLIDAKGIVSPPDRPLLIRYLLSDLMNQPDEVLINMSLGRSESKLLARLKHLTQVDVELGSILLTIRYQEDLLNNVNLSNEFLRTIRLEIGDLNRRLRKTFKKEGIEFIRTTYFNEFGIQMNKINSIRNNLENQMLDVNQTLNNQYLRFYQMQKDSLRPISKASEAYEVTTALDKLILDLSKDAKPK